MKLLNELFSAFYYRREIIKRFRQVGATSVHFAKTVMEIEKFAGSWNPMPKSALNHFIRKGVIVHQGHDMFYLDEQKLMQYRMNRVKWAMVILLLLLIFVTIKMFKK